MQPNGNTFVIRPSGGGGVRIRLAGLRLRPRWRGRHRLSFGTGQGPDEAKSPTEWRHSDSPQIGGRAFGAVQESNPSLLWIMKSSW
ncbi:MAG: serine/threonine kinase PknH [Mycobacterium sp.]|nr:serine/threonine kinase PknH [Mycobacterium sp.]